MREVISIHVGQAGIQIGGACCTSLHEMEAQFAYDKQNRGALHPRTRAEREFPVPRLASMSLICV